MINSIIKAEGTNQKENQHALFLWVNFSLLGNEVSEMRKHYFSGKRKGKKMYVCYTCGEESVPGKGEVIEFCHKCSGRILFKTASKTARTLTTN